MNNIIVDKENYGRFILKGSLALECYNDVDNKYENLYIDFNQKLGEYRKLAVKTDEDQEKIVNKLIATMEKMGIENFIIYDDGDVNYDYNKINNGDKK